MHFDEKTNKYSAKAPGSDHLIGEGSSLYAAIDDLEAKIKLKETSVRKPEVSIRVKSKFPRSS